MSIGADRRIRLTEFSVPWTAKSESRFGAVGRMLAAAARGVHAVAAPFLKRFAGTLLLSALFAVIVGVWIHSIAFSYVDSTILAGAARQGLSSPTPAILAPSTWGLAPSQIRQLIVGDGGGAANWAGILSYLFWPLQFGLVRDLISLGAIFGLFNVIPVYLIWWERKVAGRIQSRLGPMRVGGWHGWAQTIADGVKLVFKEDLIPKDADSLLFRAAPYFAVIPVALAFVALPFGATYLFRELDVALVFILGMLGVEVVGVILAGWASNNKWSVYGAMREACQMVSYEIPMGMALLVPVIIAGSLSLQRIGELQSGGWFSWMVFANPFAFAAFVSYYIASLASCKRAPFDLPEAESELVAGFHTEYSGLRWSFFFFAEYAAMFVVSGLATVLFLGAWHSPFPAAWGDRWGQAWWADGLRGLLLGGPIWFFLKAVFLLYVQLWLRWTLPRIRLDQVLYGCVQVLLPMTMLLVLGATLWTWADLSGGSGWLWFAKLWRWVLGAVGLVFAVGFIGIAGYGFYHRRRLVGNLVIDPLPAA
jgi:NADH-quinone oxidoreductase subunit H